MIFSGDTPTRTKRNTRAITLGVILIAVIAVEGIEQLWFENEFSGISSFWAFLRRLTVSAAVAFGVGLLTLRISPLLFPSQEDLEERIRNADYPPQPRSVYSNKMFIRIRWFLCAGLLAFAALALRRPDPIARHGFYVFLLLGAALAIANALFRFSLRHGVNPTFLARVQVLCDLSFLLLAVHFSGGVESPLLFCYPLCIIMAGLTLDRARCFLVVFLAWGSFAAMVWAEIAGVIPHRLFEAVPYHAAAVHLAFEPGFVVLVIVLDLCVLLLIAYFTTAIVERLSTEERHGVAVRQRSELIMEAMGIGFAIWDHGAKPDWLNPQMRLWLGLPPDMPSSQMPNLDHWTGGLAGPIDQTYRDGRVRSEERQLTDVEGNTRSFHVTTFPLLDSIGEVYEVVEIVQDTTERKRQESEMMRSSQLAALGVMAAGFAHEIGNPLASMSTRLRLLEETDDAAFQRESLGLLQRQVSRIAQIVRSLARIARPLAGEWEACSINTVVSETVNLIRFHDGSKRCTIGTELAPELPTVRGVADQLVQVFLNLGINAIEAMPAGGTLTVRTGLQDGFVAVFFEDTGSGLSPEAGKRVFDAFYSTKREGMGLGLTIAHNIVSSHQGRITVSRNTGEGSVFTVLLPITAADGCEKGVQ